MLPCFISQSHLMLAQPLLIFDHQFMQDFKIKILQDFRIKILILQGLVDQLIKGYGINIPNLISSMYIPGIFSNIAEFYFCKILRPSLLSFFRNKVCINPDGKIAWLLKDRSHLLRRSLLVQKMFRIPVKQQPTTISKGGITHLGATIIANQGIQRTIAERFMANQQIGNQDTQLEMVEV